jgi:TRAP transporter TAXI family solute receptor
VLSRRTVLRGASVAAAAAMAGCGRAPDYRSGQLRIATGGQGGVYYVYGQGIATAVRRDLPRLEPVVLATAASVDNVRMVAAGSAELAFTLADSAAAGLAGDAPFEHPMPIAALARLYDNYLHLVVSAAGTIRDLAALAGRRVSLGANGSGTELIATRLLGLVGIDPKRDLTVLPLGVDDSARSLASGGLDAFFFSGGLPVAAITALAQAIAIRLVGAGDLASKLRDRYGELYSELAIPASAYRLEEPVSTVGVSNYLVVAASFDSELAYLLTRLLFVRRDMLASAHPEARRLDRGAAIDTYPLPLHPGAVRYYREAKR